MKKAKPAAAKARFIVLRDGSTFKIIDTERREVVCQVDNDYHKPDAEGLARDRASRICSLFNQADFW